jgi:hypothetical protein
LSGRESSERWFLTKEDHAGNRQFEGRESDELTLPDLAYTCALCPKQVAMALTWLDTVQYYIPAGLLRN